MGADPVDALRQMKNVSTDPYSAGRNFCNHYSVRKWNVVPVSSPIEVQFSMAPGTAIANKRAGGRGITIVQGGDAGTAEGDFSTCLVWCSRPGNELPCLMIVANNQWGISTPASEQHGYDRIADPRQGVRHAVRSDRQQRSGELPRCSAIDYVRTERRPLLRRWCGCAATVGEQRQPGQGQVDCLERARAGGSPADHPGGIDELRELHRLPRPTRIRTEPPAGNRCGTGVRRQEPGG
jgi:hypothetical protein